MPFLHRIRLSGKLTRRRRLHLKQMAGNGIENLEVRSLLTAVTMTDNEQLLLQLINRARADPSAEAARHGITLNQGLSGNPISSDPKQPLAPHQSLVDAAQLHSQNMLDDDFFAHLDPTTNKEAPERADDAGYPTTQVGENIAFAGNTDPLDQEQEVYDRHAALFKSTLGHRQNMLHPPYLEIGNGIRYGIYTDNGTDFNAIMVTENFGIRNIDEQLTLYYVTGAAYTDTDADNFYSIGEAIRSGSITAVDTTSGATYSDEIGVSGGYKVAVPAGTYDVTASYTLESVVYVHTQTVTVTNENEQLDFESGDAVAAPAVVITGTTTLDETGTGNTATLTIERFGDTSAGAVATVTSADTGEATVLGTATFQAGSATTTFDVTGVDDADLDGAQTSLVTVSLTGHTDGTQLVTVNDTSLPVLSTSTTSFTTARPTFEWTGLANVATYEIWGNDQTHGQGRILTSTTITTNSFTPSSDLLLGGVRVWVRATSTTGQVSAWSQFVNYSILTTGAIQLSAPTFNTTSPTINWAAVAGADRYELWVNGITSNTTQYFYDTNLTTNSQILADAPIGLYRVWVRAANSANYIGKWSPSAQFYVDVAPGGLNISATDFDSSATLEWDAVAGANQYDVWIDDVTNGTVQILRDTAVASNSLSLSGLAASQYRAWVRARDTDSLNYKWSAPFEFSINAPARALTPFGSTNSTSPVITWSPVAGAATYDVWLSEIGATQIEIPTGLTTNSYQVTSTLEVGKSYRMWIRAFDSLGNTTGWNGSKDFSVVAENSPSEPASILRSLDAAFGEVDMLLTALQTPSESHTAHAEVDERKETRQPHAAHGLESSAQEAGPIHVTEAPDETDSLVKSFSGPVSDIVAAAVQTASALPSTPGVRNESC